MIKTVATFGEDGQGEYQVRVIPTETEYSYEISRVSDDGIREVLVTLLEGEVVDWEWEE